MKSIPFFLAFSSSVFLIGLEASLISVSPARNFLNPPPVPEMPTVTRTLGYSCKNSSATASVIGKTVEEPSTFTTPLRLRSASAFAKPVVITRNAKRPENKNLFIIFLLCLLIVSYSSGYFLAVVC